MCSQSRGGRHSKPLKATALIAESVELWQCDDRQALYLWFLYKKAIGLFEWFNACYGAKPFRLKTGWGTSGLTGGELMEERHFLVQRGYIIVDGRVYEVQGIRVALENKARNNGYILNDEWFLFNFDSESTRNQALCYLLWAEKVRRAYVYFIAFCTIQSEWWMLTGWCYVPRWVRSLMVADVLCREAHKEEGVSWISLVIHSLLTRLLILYALRVFHMPDYETELCCLTQETNCSHGTQC